MVFYGKVNLDNTDPPVHGETKTKHHPEKHQTAHDHGHTQRCLPGLQHNRTCQAIYAHQDQHGRYPRDDMTMHCGAYKAGGIVAFLSPEEKERDGKQLQYDAQEKEVSRGAGSRQGVGHK